MQAQGQIPTFSAYNASVVDGNLIYISGGKNYPCSPASSQITNELFTLNSEGVFEKVETEGAMPSPRSHHAAWMYKNNIYLGFGNKVEDEGTDFIQGGDCRMTTPRNVVLTNQIVKFDLERKMYSNFPTHGSRPMPRKDFGAAKLESKVFICGGISNGFECMRDFVLDMETSQWSELPSLGLKRGAKGLSLTALPPYQIFCLGGGGNPEYVSDKGRIFNSRDSTWTEEQSLPKEFCGEDGGLWHHRAFSVEKENQVTKIICIGGFIDKGERQYSNHMLEFKIPRTTRRGQDEIQ